MIWFILFGLVFLGIIFIFLEITVIPGLGIGALLGGISLIASFAYAFYQAVFLKTITISMAFAFFSVSLTFTLAVLFLGIKMLSHTKFGKSLVLTGEQREEYGYTAVSEELEMFLGEVGEAVTDLRPAGYARIAGKKIDVVTRGDYVRAGDKIKVIAIDGNDIIVEKWEETEEGKEENTNLKDKKEDKEEKNSLPEEKAMEA